MKKYLFIVMLLVSTQFCKSQNLIENPSFDKHRGNGGGVGFSDSMNNSPQLGECLINDWIRIGGTPDGYWFIGQDFPMNYHSDYIYPHSDSICVGAFYMFHGMGGGQTTREIIEGKLTKPLTASHHYQFSMYVQLFDTIEGNVIDIGKIVGVNSFSAVFTDTMIPSHNYLPITNYKPQVQINQMVTDTQHWVLLVDTFISAGGEQFVSIGNFKPDSLIQYQLVDSIRNLAIASYYYMDDVSLIDLDDTTNGVQEQLAVKSNQLMVYPNPVNYQLTVSSNQFKINTFEVTNLLGQIQNVKVEKPTSENCQLNTENLPSGIYFIKATDINGNVSAGKFVKE